MLLNILVLFRLPRSEAYWGVLLPAPWNAEHIQRGVMLKIAIFRGIIQISENWDG